MQNQCVHAAQIASWSGAGAEPFQLPELAGLATFRQTLSGPHAGSTLALTRGSAGLPACSEEPVRRAPRSLGDPTDPSEVKGRLSRATARWLGAGVLLRQGLGG